MAMSNIWVAAGDGDLPRLRVSNSDLSLHPQSFNPFFKKHLLDQLGQFPLNFTCSKIIIIHHL